MAGLLLVLAFLGHDLLMAALASAATASPPAAQHQSSSPSGPADTHPITPEPHHLQDCGIGQWAAPRARDEPEVIPTALPPRGVSQSVSTLHRGAAPLWREPGRSAANRRALFQVYRI